jgi:hypothetical protein
MSLDTCTRTAFYIMSTCLNQLVKMAAPFLAFYAFLEKKHQDAVYFVGIDRIYIL